MLLHSSVIERFAAHAPGLTGVTRRTLRTNLRFLARAVVPALAPADTPLPREHAKHPYSPAEIVGYLALADAQPTAARRMRASGLICLGAGAGLIRADLRQVRGTDVTARSGGVIVAVRGRRPRAVPVVARYHQPLLAAAAFAGTGLVTVQHQAQALRLPDDVTSQLREAPAGRGGGLTCPRFSRPQECAGARRNPGRSSSGLTALRGLHLDNACAPALL